MSEEKKIFYRRRYPAANFWTSAQAFQRQALAWLSREIGSPVANTLRVHRFSLSLSLAALFALALAALLAPDRVWTEKFWFGKPEDVRTLVLLLASTGGAILAIIGIRLSHLRAKASTKQTQTSEETFFTELLVKAGGQLASDKSFVRIVGVNSILRLALHSAQDRTGALNVLNQFLQEHLPYTLDNANVSQDAARQVEQVYRTRGDVTAAARAISEIVMTNRSEAFDVRFRNSIFPTNVEFPYGLSGATFENCHFLDHDLRSNEFSDCMFSKVWFNDSEFNLTRFVNCEFSDFSGFRKKFPTTLFKKCTFSDGRFSQTYFGRSTINDCVFLNTTFFNCDFHRVDFDRSRFVDSKLQSCELSGAFLGHLTPDEIRQTFDRCVYHISNPPILPKHSSIESFECFTPHEDAHYSVTD